jgi:hypothetical protein
MAAHLTRSDCEGFSEMLYIQCNGTDADTLWNGSEDEGNECEDGDNDTDWSR